MLTDNQKKRFAKIWAARFGLEISDEDADREGSRLVRVVHLLSNPTPADESKDIQNSRKEIK